MRQSLSSLLRRTLGNPNRLRSPNQSRLPLSTLASPHPNPSPRVSALVDEISSLTLLEAADLTEALRFRLGVDQLPVMAILTPGMAAGGAPGVGGAAVAEEKKVEEKTAFDLKLESFDAAAKIKIIKEVRTFTDLGLKEAKELVEKAPTVIKTGVAKEEAEKIMEKLKEIGAKIVLE
ncbi:uncharacterized protein [Typha angustifolia]|uniref:uncharacterized protein n=1 Tax=Typha angustifolia TaxID=59011 RepID=UPI003C2E4029